jgi:formate hydrogenlyase subunit 6/NADH:ubiquinone oxidoreductase subunit I
MFSPVLVSRTGPCEPECSLCGTVCPSQAIMSLPLEEKQQAKIGTAVVQPGLCLGWAEGRSCMVCQEVCPYGAIVPVQKEGAAVPSPIVRAQRCVGCGYCEYHCPVFIPAITVQPLNALRLTRRQYRAAATAAGLDLMPVATRQFTSEAHETIPEGSLPPGFTE